MQQINGISINRIQCLVRLKQVLLIIGLLMTNLVSASIESGSVSPKLSTTPVDVGLTNSEQRSVFVQVVNPIKSGEAQEVGNGQWRFNTSDGSNTSDLSAYYIAIDGAPALLGVPSEAGTLVVGENNEIEDLWTDRIFSRPVVFVSFEDPSSTSGAIIVPTAPITSGNQFLFDIRFAEGVSANFAGAKVHYFIAEEGWHRLVDGRMLLVSSTELKDTGFSGKTIELGATFNDAVTVAQLQRPMLFHNGTLFRNLLDMETYQGATVTAGIGDISSVSLRLMQERNAEESYGSRVFAGRVGFMVLGNLTSIANTIKTHLDTSTNIRGGSYLTVPKSHFQNYPHSAATSPLLNKAACAEDDDVQNYCIYLSMPVDVFSRGLFDTPRLPYVDSDFEPLEMERTLYSEAYDNWEAVVKAEMAAPVTDADNQPITGTLAQMFPNFVADRGWDHVLIGSNNYWHWFATYHYNTCVFDSVNTACVDYAPGDTIIEDRTFEWIPTTSLYDYEERNTIGLHAPADTAQGFFIVNDSGLNDKGSYSERLTPPSWAANQTLDYLNFDVPTDAKLLKVHQQSQDRKVTIERLAEPWQFAYARIDASLTEVWCDSCETIPTYNYGAFQATGNLTYQFAVYPEDYHYLMDSLPHMSYTGESHVKPQVAKVGQNIRVGDYLFANIAYSIEATNFVWLRSATGKVDDAVVVATNQLGYQATVDDGNSYVTMCMTFNNSQRCGNWIKVGQIPFATNVKVKPQYAEPLAGAGLIGQYTYIAPNNNAYDGLEYQSLYQWQYAQSDTWVDYAGENEITFQKDVAAGTVIRFCVTPSSHLQSGPTECSVGVKMQLDTDGDGISDDWDIDDDNDGYADWEDRFPIDASEYLDTDRDGIGNNADLDDDNDGISDEDELAGLTDPLKYDTDGDGTSDSEDPFPTSYGNFPDFDNDGLDDTVDDDIDGDGVVDFIELTFNGETFLRRLDDDPYSPCVSNHITVTSNADNGPGSLRQALIDLCPSEVYSELSVIDFSDAMTITLQSPLLIKKGVEINANHSVVLDAQGQSGIFYVAMTAGLAGTQFPHLIGLTLRNGASYQADDLVASTDSGNGSAIHMQSNSTVILDSVLIENMTAPAINGDDFDLYMENSLIANVSGRASAVRTTDGQISLFSSTLYNSEGGTIAIWGDGKAQLRNSLLLKGPNGSTVCNVSNWEQQTASWVEDSECGISSTGTVELADPDNGDYRPIPGSANIDTGETGELPSDAVDLLGNARLMGEYNPDNPEELGGPIYPKLDIGAIEYDFYGDFDGDGTDDLNDAFPLDVSESADTDNDGVGDNSDAFPDDADETMDSDGDGIGDNADLDDDNDGYSDRVEIDEGSDPLDATSTPLDTDQDGEPDSTDTDDDNDSVPDSEDAFPLDATESVDTDGDGIGNNADTDDDNDSVPDSEDVFPLDATESVDTDGDGIGNNADTDDDGDNVADSEDAFPLDATESVDTDGDGIGNNADTDDDGDNVADSEDAFPLDETESEDTDGDGIGNNTDTDDDNDGYSDAIEVAVGSDPLDSNSRPLDTDLDGIPDSIDTDDDNDGVVDSDDTFPLDSSESVDTDGDSIGNNADLDDDGDNVADSEDAFPLDSSESVDTDGDGIGNNADLDDDGDGVADSDDAFPLDKSESVDTDGDGIGNNADLDDDGDSVADSEDAFPLDSTEWLDTDLDGVGDNADSDDDNDGILDVNDAEPLSVQQTSGGGSMFWMLLFLTLLTMRKRTSTLKKSRA
ncbi:hypothetical protein [Aliikangiella sp. G2MR2-5]|uniref:hypothetical protein n=1 Tax=Aliikangiella sp. G2MR2-5 TaxID=2788943 RepID=UPI0018AA6F5D|nr:hypothetical protein [Aliikangiella sp. G2MR2-5]